METLTEKVNKCEPKKEIPARIEIYSPKLGVYVSIDNKPQGEIQISNIGMGPGSWY